MKFFKNASTSKRNLGFRLLIGFTTLVVSLGTYYSYEVVRNVMLESLKKNAFLEVQQHRDDIDRWLENLKLHVNILANTTEVRSMDWSVAEPFLKAEVERSQKFLYFTLANPDGSSNNTAKRHGNVKDRQWFSEGMRGKRTIDDPVVSRSTGVTVIHIIAPMVTTSDSRPVGVLAGTITITRAVAVVDQLKSGAGSFAFALNSQGIPIAHPNPKLIGTPEKPAPSFLQSSDATLAKIAHRMVNRQQGIELLPIDGSWKYVVYLPLQEANWSLALIIPRENIESQLRALDIIALVVVGLAGTMIAVLWQVQAFEQTQLKKSKEVAERAKAAADAASNAKSEFLANMSHELRTPLNGILGYAQILERSKNLDDKDKKGVGIIYQCGSHLLTLINDVLDLSKIEARKLELVPIAFHLPSFLESVAEICRVRAEQKGIAFVYEPDANLPVGIHADEKRLCQVLINLLGNAIKFTENGSVTFRIKSQAIAPVFNVPQQRCLYFEVIDTGVGMTPAQLEKIFLPFEQVGNTNKQSEGTGLGLAISLKIISLMNSRIQVMSEVGKGSTFWFKIKVPVATNWAKASRTVQQGIIAAYDGQKRKVLVVDDKWENRSVIVNLLEPIGFEVIEASNGQEGLDQAYRQQPDLIITDLVMPEMHGFELLRQLRQSPTLKDRVMIASSASVFEADQFKSLDAGASAFLPKPVQADALLDLMQKHLNLSWVYEESSALQPDDYEALPETDAKELIPPPIDILTHLYELTQDGDFDAVSTEAEKLRKEHPKYREFAQRLQQLAEDCQLEEVETLLKQFLKG
ncbi:MAG: response regulator [Stigonema ocellatum SAG 48.90 = DSM 106950]|nr:response regulator [Stigonema ocellatum SAG 48.90 = DSM 106950]